MSVHPWHIVLLFSFCSFFFFFFFFSSRRRHTRSTRDWSSDVCSSDLDQRFPRGGRGGSADLAGDAGTALAEAPPDEARRRGRPHLTRDRGLVAEIGRASCRERV